MDHEFLVGRHWGLHEAFAHQDVWIEDSADLFILPNPRYHLQRQQSDIVGRHRRQTQWIEAEEGLVNHPTGSYQPDSEKRGAL